MCCHWPWFQKLSHASPLLPSSIFTGNGCDKAEGMTGSSCLRLQMYTKDLDDFRWCRVAVLTLDRKTRARMFTASATFPQASANRPKEGESDPDAQNIQNIASKGTRKSKLLQCTSGLWLCFVGQGLSHLQPARSVACRFGRRNQKGATARDVSSLLPKLWPQPAEWFHKGRKGRTALREDSCHPESERKKTTRFSGILTQPQVPHCFSCRFAVSGLLTQPIT